MDARMGITGNTLYFLADSNDGVERLVKFPLQAVNQFAHGLDTIDARDVGAAEREAFLQVAPHGVQ